MHLVIVTRNRASRLKLGFDRRRPVQRVRSILHVLLRDRYKLPSQPCRWLKRSHHRSHQSPSTSREGPSSAVFLRFKPCPRKLSEGRLLKIVALNLIARVYAGTALYTKGFRRYQYLASSRIKQKALLTELAAPFFTNHEAETRRQYGSDCEAQKTLARARSNRRGSDAVSDRQGRPCKVSRSRA